MPSPRHRLIGAAAIVLAAVAAAYAQGNQSGIALRTYTDPQGRYTLQVPASWQATAKDDAVAFSWARASLTVYHQPGPTDASGVLNTFAQRTRSATRNYTESSPAVIMVDGFDARTLVFSGAGAEGEPARGRIVGVYNGRYGLAFVLAAPAAQFEADHAAFSRLLSSFRFGAAPVAAGTAGGFVKLPERTRVKLALLGSLKSGNAKKGDEVTYEVTEDVLGPNREILIPRGTLALGTVLRSQGRKAFGKPGKLDISVASTRAVDGTKVPLRSSEDLAVRGRNNVGAVTALAVLVSPLGFLVKGRDVTYKRGTEFLAYVDQDVLVDTSKTAAALP